jgi:FtsP/CotA-like multicopper oxidase with cupredoxin domain
MNINYKKWFIIIGLVDIILIGLIAAGGVQYFNRITPGRSFIAQEADQQPEEEASIITVHTPEQINAGNDFTLVLQIHNQNTIPIHIREVILPSLIVNNMEVAGTEPAVDHINSYDAGKGFPFNLVIPAGKDQLFSFVLTPSKMLAINAEVLTYTDNFIIPTLVQFAVAP